MKSKTFRKVTVITLVFKLKVMIIENKSNLDRNI